MLGAAVWGAGWVSGEHLKAYRANPHTEVVAIGSRTKDEARAKAESLGISCEVYDDLEEMVARRDVHAVSICTPHHLHVPNLELAAAAGKHALVEKPLALTVDGLLRARQAVQRSGVRAMVGFELHWHPYIRMLDNLVRDGTLGDVVFLEAGYFSEQGPWWPGFQWGITREQGGSVISVAACHAVEFLCSFGGEVDEVFAYHTRRNRQDYEYQPTVAGLIRFRNGVLGALNASFEVHAPYCFPVVVGGSKGAVREGKLHADRFLGQTDWMRLPVNLPDSPDVSGHPFQGEIDYFVDCILNDREPFLSVASSLSTEAGLALDLSAECGRPVKLPLCDRDRA